MHLVKIAATLINNRKQTIQRSECEHSLNQEKTEENGREILNGSTLGKITDIFYRPDRLLMVILFSSKASELKKKKKKKTVYKHMEESRTRQWREN